MKVAKKYIIGNWKANKSQGEVENWFAAFSEAHEKDKFDRGNLEIVICPPVIYLSLAQSLILKYNLPILLGAQDLSEFAGGAYTGEVTAAMISEYASYVIVGHSERRENFREDVTLLAEKVRRAKEKGLQVIYCVPDQSSPIPGETDIVAYEPVWAIGTGKAETPQNANAVGKAIKEKTKVPIFIYGGSVTAQNVAEFVKEEYIDGVLPGGASLDPQLFFGMIVKVSLV